MPRKPPTPKPSTTKKSTGRSADAMAGSAAAKKKAASKATDAVSRRFKSTESEWNGSGGKTVRDKVTGISRSKYSDNSSAKKPIYYYANDAKTAAKYKSEKNMKKKFGK